MERRVVVVGRCFGGIVFLVLLENEKRVEWALIFNTRVTRVPLKIKCSVIPSSFAFQLSDWWTVYALRGVIWADSGGWYCTKSSCSLVTGLCMLTKSRSKYWETRSRVRSKIGRFPNRDVGQYFLLSTAIIFVHNAVYDGWSTMYSPTFAKANCSNRSWPFSYSLISPIMVTIIVSLSINAIQNKLVMLSLSSDRDLIIDCGFIYCINCPESCRLNARQSGRKFDERDRLPFGNCHAARLRLPSVFHFEFKLGRSFLILVVDWSLFGVAQGRKH